MVDDGARDRIERRGAGQRGSEPVQPRRPRDESAVSRFAGAERRFDLVPFDQLALGALPLRVRLGVPLLRRFVLPRAIERLRAARGERLHVVAV